MHDADARGYEPLWIRIHVHVQTFLSSGRAKENGDDWSKPEYQSYRAPGKVEPAVWHGAEFGGAKWAEIANGPARAYMTAEEKPRAPAEIPRELAVVEAQHIG